MPDLLHLSTDQWIAFWTGAVTGLLGLAALAGTVTAVVLTFQANSRERARDEQQDRDRVDRWLAEFVVNAALYAAACRTWISNREAVQNAAWERGYTGDPDELNFGTEPDPSAMTASLEAARLVGRGLESGALSTAARYLRQVVFEDIEPREQLIDVLISDVQDWRKDPSTTSDFIADLLNGPR